MSGNLKATPPMVVICGHGDSRVAAAVAGDVSPQSYDPLDPYRVSVSTVPIVARLLRLGRRSRKTILPTVHAKLGTLGRPFCNAFDAGQRRSAFFTRPGISLGAFATGMPASSNARTFDSAVP